jgi:hypothetical protein
MAAKGNSCFWLANVKKIFSSETACPNGTKLGRKHLCKILYKTSSFNSILRGPSNDYLIKVWFQLSNWFQTRWFLCEFPIGSYVKLSTAVQPSWSEGGTTRHNFGRGPSNDYLIKVWFQLSNWFQTRRFLWEFPIGSYVKLSSAVVDENHLVWNQ